MKDLYTFDESEETAMATYENVSAAYTRIFDRIGQAFLLGEKLVFHFNF